MLPTYTTPSATAGEDKMDPIVEKVMGTEQQRLESATKRLDIREILGTKTMREITLK